MGDDIPDFMDIDLGEIPDELLDVNDEFIDIYLKNVRGELIVLWDLICFIRAQDAVTLRRVTAPCPCVYCIASQCRTCASGVPAW